MQKTETKISVVVVTFNRLHLLQKNIDLLLHQTRRVDRIYIINNASTDGTADFLRQIASNPLFVIQDLDTNIGGAGGFSLGIKQAVRDGADWVWVMDDDTMPTDDSLEKLLVTTDEQTGFVCSKVLWTDNTMHIMNIPDFVHDSDTQSPVRNVRSASFVSLLLNAVAVRKVGLPYKEFFIWGDDAEYTQRIVRAGYAGFWLNDSVVLHETASNYGPDISSAPYATAWKFYYNMRNTMFMDRRKYGSGLKFYFKEINHLRLALHNISKRKTTERKNFRKAVVRGFCDGLTFRPEIDYV